MKQLIINADDFGKAESINRAICELYELGIVSSTSCMPNMPAWPQAAEYLRRNPEFGAGVHLVFNDGYPLLPTDQVPALLREDGQFLEDRQILLGARPGTNQQLLAEFRAQIERFSHDTGSDPDHLDNHCSVSYKRPDRFKVTLKLAKEYNLPIRAPFGDDLEKVAPILSKRNDLPIWLILWMGRWYRQKVDQASISRPNTFIAHFSMMGNQTPDYLLGILNDLEEGWISELLVHPGYDGDWREQELRALLDPRVRERLAQPDIELVNFSALKE
jgi:predicted glycoside hydrolase/deacetylase ChbG (UPF0249 family)